MASRTEFWLHMHKLAYALDGEGATPQERVENILGAFRQMQPVVQREVLTDLRVLARALAEIEMRAIAVNREATQPATGTPPNEAESDVA